MKTINRFLLLALIVSMGISAYVVLPLPRPGVKGYYFGFGLIWCTDRTSCLHEVGHLLDDRAGWISKSKQYIGAVELYETVQALRSPNPDMAWKTFTVFFYQNRPDGPDRSLLMELYATMFAAAGGKPENMEPSFRHFYNWQLAAELIRKYAP